MYSLATWLRCCRPGLGGSLATAVRSNWRANNYSARAYSLQQQHSTEVQRSMTTMGEDKFRKLPELAKPSLYKIRLAPCLKTFKCPGEASIQLEILKETESIVLHASELEIQAASLKFPDGVEWKNLKVDLDKKWTLLKVNLPKKIAPTKDVCLSFKYVAELNDQMQGFSRSVYKSETGAQKTMASTQFESTYARLAFPCFDEPTYKAKFDVTMEVDSELTALSNMPVIKETPNKDAGTKVVEFGTTPLMSTYVLAFAVGEFEYIESKSKDGIPVRVYTVPGKKEQGRFALELAANCLDFYGDWFGIKSPLPKCDLIAIPDFSMGAMENWGLVTYREVCILVDKAKSSIGQRMQVALTVSHELAHFWFGNLVTMKWWTDLWLKEGFASFMEYVCTHHHHPEFKVWLHFLTDEVSSGMDLDGLRNSHPIEVEIGNPNELDEIYDSITYAKSNSMIRMLCNYLSEPVFKKGLQIYLKRYQYSNTQTTDLWDALKEASGKDINALMSSWTKQMGYPVIEVKQVGKTGEAKCVLKLTQSRFISDGGADELKSIWQVPVGVISASSPDEPHTKLLLTGREGEFPIDGVDPKAWIKLNDHMSGFYRVNYSEPMFNALLPVFREKKISVEDRFNIADDLFALVESGKVPATRFLELVKQSAEEDEYIVWRAIDGGVGSLRCVLEHHSDPSVLARFDKFISKYYAPLAEKFGWEADKGEGGHEQLLRVLIHGRLAKAGHQPTIDEALNKFEEHTKQGVELEPNFRPMIYGVACREKPDRAVESLKQIYNTCGFSEQERNTISALGQCSDPQLLAGIYKFAIEEGGIRSQDFISLFAGSQVAKMGREFTWGFFKDHYPLLLEKFGSVNSSNFQRCFKFSANSLCSEEAAKDVESFCEKSFDAHALKTLDRPIRQVVESIRLNKKLLDSNVTALSDYLAKESP